ncbi:pyruvate formate-lyase-activating protein [Clostridium polynesiense]|uniref:pyruvate formate-lyase-activating protein n=1 Tax=Clostridium polynesiense TaxID=1325933 RepID=UPI00058AC965
MGLVDGPGVRVVVFFQGCSLRCAFCHNPDTWGANEGEEITSQDLLKKILRYKTYFKSSGGGITFSGGEPLLQPDFLIEMLKLCRENGIHTTIDTAGCGIGKYSEILKYTDLVLFDIKHIDAEEYKKMTRNNINESLKFLEAVQQSGNKMWIRQVIIPNLNDSREYIKGLADIINTLNNVEKVELLPYHLLGVSKYEALGKKYRLEGVPEMDKEKNKELEDYLKTLISKKI